MSSVLVQIPHSPRGDGNISAPIPSSASSSGTRSDTFLPVRGRKHTSTRPNARIKIRYIIPRKGTETRLLRPLLLLPTPVQIPFSPRGDGNDNQFFFHHCHCLCSDTFLPVRGLTYISCLNAKSPHAMHVGFYF